MKEIEYGPGLKTTVLEEGDTIRAILSDETCDYIEIITEADGIRVRCGDGHLVVLPRVANEVMIGRRLR